MRVTRNDIQEDGVYVIPEGLLKVAIESLSDYDLTGAALVKDATGFFYKLRDGLYVEAEDAKNYFKEQGLNYRHVDSLGLEPVSGAVGGGVAEEEVPATLESELVLSQSTVEKMAELVKEFAKVVEPEEKVEESVDFEREYPAVFEESKIPKDVPEDVEKEAKELSEAIDRAEVDSRNPNGEVPLN